MTSKLTVYAFSDPEMRTKMGNYIAQINPETLSAAHQNSCVAEGGINTGGQRLKYRSQKPRALNFTFVIDSTGLIPGVDNVSDEIAAFENTVFSPKKAEHIPNYLSLVCADFVFPCRLTNLSITYVMFSLSGQPLRAKLTVEFCEHLTAKQIMQRTGIKPDDLTRYDW